MPVNAQEDLQREQRVNGQHSRFYSTNQGACRFETERRIERFFPFARLLM